MSEVHTEKKDRRSLKERISDFWFEHVKLMVFIIAMVVLLMTLGPFSIYEISLWINDIQNVTTDDVMSMEQLISLTDSGVDLHWRHFAAFHGDRMTSDDHYVTWMIPVGIRYEIRMGGEDTDSPPDYVYLYDMTGDGDRIDLKTDSVRSFLATRQ